MKKIILMCVVGFSFFALADVKQADQPEQATARPPVPLVLKTKLKYTPDAKAGDKLELAVRLRRKSEAVIRNLDAAQVDVLIDGQILPPVRGEVSVTRGTVFPAAEQASVFVVNGSRIMRIFSSEVSQFFSELGAQISDQSGLVSYGNGQNQISTGWEPSVTAVGLEVASILSQPMQENEQAPDTAVAIQDAFRKLAERPETMARSLFVLTDGSGLQDQDPASVALALNEILGRQDARDSIDFYLIDFSKNDALSAKIHQLSSELKQLPNGMNVKYFKATKLTSLLAQIKKDRQVDHQIVVSGQNLLPPDGLTHQILFQFDLPDGVLSVPYEYKTAKAGIPYRNFIFAGLGIGLFAIIAMAILMIFVRKS
jgi:hypothetical protein